MRNPEICPVCGSSNNRVTDSRLEKGMRYRRRKCECGKTWGTVELDFSDYTALLVADITPEATELQKTLKECIAQLSKVNAEIATKLRRQEEKNVSK